MEEKWKELKVEGWMAHVIKEKLKYVKEKLRVWNREVFGVVDLNIEQVVKELNGMEDAGDEETEWDGEKWRKLNAEFWEELHKKESLLAQKARERWIQQGDGNTRFFHNAIKVRQRRNQIEMIKVEDRWLSEVEEIKEEVRIHFGDQFNEQHGDRPTLDRIQFKQLSEREAENLTEPFTMEEIKEAVWSCESSKSPGPDGFNFLFIKECWNTVKEEILELMKQFHTNGKIPKAFIASFVALIGKTQNPQRLSEFWPISLIGCMYKIIAKILATRLKGVLTGVISPTQTAFLQGRQILDGVVVANEVINVVKKKKWPAMLFKVDFEKAYDSVN